MLAAGALKALLSRMTERGVTIFLTSHVLEIVERLCSHVAIIHKGRLVAQVHSRSCARGSPLRKAARRPLNKFPFDRGPRTARSPNSKSSRG